MKKLLLSSVFIYILSGLYAQEKEVLKKKGWNFGALPAVTFDSDLGFQYGALVNLYNYGDGSRYPVYNHSLYIEVSRFTKGSGINRIYYDSDRLIKGVQTSIDISYLSDLAYDFYGFNGYDAVVNKNWFDDDDKADYKSRMFYKYDRKLFRFKADLTGNLLGHKLKWTSGINLLNFKLGLVDIDKLNKGKDDDDKLPSHEKQPGLYQKYQEWGLIAKEDADGGFVPVIKAGVVFDTRDNKPNPMKGFWTELVLAGSPEFMGGEHNFMKISIIHRQYFTIIPKDLSFAYRLTYQTTLTGNTPFYYQTQMITSVMKGATSEGLGGGSSLRGVLRNRVVGDGIFLGNLEARWKFARFKFIKNNFYLGLNAFVDFGRVTKKIKTIDVDKINTILNDYFDNNAEKMHYSYGGGLRAAMNENFIARCDFGLSADERDGTSGIYIGLNYLF